MPANEDTSGDSNTPQQAPPQAPPPPPIKRYKNEEGGNGRQNRSQVANDENDPPHWTRYVETACAILLVIITGYYAYFAKQQWVEAQKTANAAICATRISADALKLTRDVFKATQAAVLQPSVELEAPAGDAFVAVVFRNTGHSQAQNIVGSISFGRFDEHGKRVQHTIRPFRRSTVAEDSFLGEYISLGERLNITSPTQQHMTVKGYISYDNGVEKDNRQSFCFGVTTEKQFGSQKWEDCENVAAMQRTMK